MAGLAFIPLIIIGILFFVFWIIILIDAVTRKFKEDSEKIVWVIVIIFASFIGALIYYFIVYRKYKSLMWFWITLLILVILLILFALFFGAVNYQTVPA